MTMSAIKWDDCKRACLLLRANSEMPGILVGALLLSYLDGVVWYSRKKAE